MILMSRSRKMATSKGGEYRVGKKSHQENARCKEYFSKLVCLAVTMFILQLSIILHMRVFIPHCTTDVMSN